MDPGFHTNSPGTTQPRTNTVKGGQQHDMGSVKYLTASEKQKIIELSQTHIDGRLPTYTEISRQVGRCRATVRRVLEATRGPNPRPRRLTIGEKNRIIKLYQTRNGNRWM